MRTFGKNEEASKVTKMPLDQLDINMPVSTGFFKGLPEIINTTYQEAPAAHIPK
jgi:hypothetical protein